MRSFLAVVGSVALVAAAPANQAAPIDFGAVLAAPDPTQTGPDPSVASQTDIYDPATAAASASAAVTAAATASATASVAARSLEAGLQERGFCFFGFCFGTTTSKSGTYATTTATSTSVPVMTTTSSPSAGTTSAPVYVVPSTCTPVSWTNTFAFITTDTACPLPYEVGTYCGFINPEDPCAVQPDGYGPQVTPDTVPAFQAYAPFHQSAQKAVTPKGYASTFKDYNASVNANSYMGYRTLTSYDVAGCASWCDGNPLCTGFNIFVERDPSFNPGQCSCTNPASLTNYKCSIWGSGVEAAAANNLGQNRVDFQVVIVASNGYEKSNTTTPTTPGGWTNPQNCSSTVHNHGSTCIGQKFFPGPFDVSVCAAYAASQNAKNKNVLYSLWAMLTGYNPSKCNFFNAYMLKQNGVAKGTYCNLFAQQYQPSQATYQPGWNGGKYWGVETSWSYCSK